VSALWRSGRSLRLLPMYAMICEVRYGLLKFSNSVCCSVFMHDLSVYTRVLDPDDSLCNIPNRKKP
jgi:hypothetical protein